MKDKIAEKINKSLSYSVKDASFWSVMAGFGESYLSAFGVFLKASSFQIAMLGALPQLISAILQIFAFKLTTIFKSRKRLVLLFASLQACMWLAIIGISYWTQNAWVLIGLACVYFIFGAMGGPAWSSWMGDLVPTDYRGRYFGRRNRIAGFVSFISMVLGGIILDRFSLVSSWGAFAIIFTIAFWGRVVSVTYLSLKYEPRVVLREPQPVPFIDFIKNLRKSDIGMFSLYILIMQAAINLSAPLLIIYWLNYLHFSYFQLMAAISIAAVASFITMTYWGAHADRYGNKAMLWAASYLLALVPLSWFLLTFVPSAAVFPIALVIQAFTGFATAGFDLTAGNFVYDLIEPAARIRMISYYNILRGTGIFIGGLIGGLLMTIPLPRAITDVLPVTILFVFLLSATARIAAPSLFVRRISEVKVVKHRANILQVVTLMPVQGLAMESIVGMNRTIRTFREQLKKVEKHLEYWEKTIKKV